MSRDGHAAILVKTRGLAPGARIDRHTHDDHQLAWARKGILTVAAEGGTWVIPPSRALWIPAGVPHEITTSGPATLRSAYLRPAHCPVAWPAPQPLSAGPLLSGLIDHLASNALDPERRSRAEAVLIDILEPVAGTTIDAPMPKDGPAREVAQALRDDPTDGRSLRQWGSQVGTSARTLARAFVNDTGIPFGRWRTAVRLQAALPHLAAGESVARVARRVGYGTPSAFVAAFRRETGLTPGGYFRTHPPMP